MAVKRLQSVRLYEFGPFRLDPVKRLLLRDGQAVQLAPKAFDTLLVLVENAGQVVEKDDLLKMIWPDSFVEEVNLTVYISALRKILGESPGQHRYIVTVPRRGYSFVASVAELRPESADNAQGRLKRSPEAVTTGVGAGFSRIGRRVLAACLIAGVIGALSWFLWTRQSRQQTSPAGKSVAAHHAYLRGMYFWNKRTEEALKKSIEYFQQAVSLDPGYALAHAGMADASALMALNAADEPARREFYEKARAAATRALELDETIAEAHTALALVKSRYENDLPGARRQQQRAIELKPDDATARQRHAWFLLASGQLERAAPEMQRAAELDPLSVANNTAWATFLYYLGQTDRAIEQCRKTLEIDPNFPNARFVLGLAYEQKGQYEQAITEIRKATPPGPENIDLLEGLGHVYAASGREAAARRRIAELEKLIGKNNAALYSVALIYAGLGDKNRAFAWLEKAAAAQADPNYHIHFDPRLAVLREDPRFENFLRLRQAAFANR